MKPRIVVNTYGTSFQLTKTRLSQLGGELGGDSGRRVYRYVLLRNLVDKYGWGSTIVKHPHKLGEYYWNPNYGVDVRANGHRLQIGCQRFIGKDMKAILKAVRLASRKKKK